MKDKSYESILLVGCILLIVLGVIYIPRFIKNYKNENSSIEEFNIERKENYKANEIIPIYVDDEEMSKLYLMDFMNMLIYDIDESYNLFNEEYRDKKFNSLISYKEYINSMSIPVNNSVKKYAVYNIDDYKCYDIYDVNNNRFVFKTNGVMQYEVYFDDIELNEEDK